MIRSSTPFFVAILCWLCWVSFDNGFDQDWWAYAFLNYTCSTADQARTWLWLIGAGVGIGFAGIFMIIFAKQNFGRFMVFLALAVLIAGFILRSATMVGGLAAFDLRILSLVLSFVVFISGGMIVAIGKPK